MKYKFVYEVYFSSCSTGTKTEIVESPIFDFPNPISREDIIILPPLLDQISARAHHHIDKNYSTLEITERVSDNKDLEGRICLAKEVFAKLNKSLGR